MKISRLTLLALYLSLPLLLLAQGKSKAGKYYERYDLPFEQMLFQDGRKYYNGKVRIWLDTEYDGTPYLYIDFKDASGEYIYHEFFLDETKPTVYYIPSEEVPLMRNGKRIEQYGMMKNSYQIPWGNYRYRFSYYENPGAPRFYAIELFYATPGTGKSSRNKDSWSCMLKNTSDGAKIERIFNELRRRRAINYIQK